ncbi:MAG TPA: hypothetical protein VFM51_11745 [Solirubrobacterales bacterium]|nr:hypothetical protein [Solirubrobacterales bacterium]
MSTLLAICLAAMLALAATAFAGGTEEVIAPSDPHDPQVDSGWQAGTCDTEAVNPGAPGAEVCSVDTPEWFFEQAAGHPHWGFTQFIVKSSPGTLGPTPDAELARIRVDLPVGLNVNPGATERCELETFETDPAACPAESHVGDSYVTAADPLLGGSVPLHAEVYNIVPVEGESARFGLNLAGNNVYLEGDADWSGDYHEGFTIEVPAALPEDLGVLLGTENGAILKNRLVFKGRSGDGTFITTPSTCLGEAFVESGSVYSTYLLAGSVAQFAEPSYVWPQSAEPPLESPIPPGTSPKECPSIPYDPGLDVDPGTTQTNSPAGVTVDIDIPHYSLEEGEQQTSTTKSSAVTLPLGVGLNPSAANGLQVCTDAQFGKGTRNPVACPAASQIGTVTVDSPALPTKEDGEEGEAEGPALTGPVYVGQQLSSDPTSGNLYRIFINAVSPRYGIDVRLVGNVSADPQTGQLTTTISNTPQSQVEEFVVELEGGPTAAVSSPPICGPHEGGAVMTPWSDNAAATPTDSFSLTTAPGGGECAKTMAERPFGPGFGAGPASTKAGAFSPLTVTISRPDGQQELKGTDITLPPGMVGKLAGIPYCPEPALASAATRAGTAEKASSSCPAESQVGTATVTAGTGSAPYKIEGSKVFLSGPYKGAPLSLAVVTPATAGPFDLGTVVVRVALFVNSENAQIRAVSDPLPHIFGGTQLNVRSIVLSMDRPDFTLNPTSCDLLATTGALLGGGGDPANPAAFSAFGVSVPFQTSDCGALKFRPKLRTTLLGGRKVTKRSRFPAFRAVLTAREGDANIGRAALTLPHSLFLEQGHIGTICTRVQLAASTCPKRSVYGFARAKSPLLDDELKGPVYLVSSDNELPDLLADLHGQVNIRLRGVISSSKARIKTVFSSVPDVPVNKFTLNMKGGKKGLLVNSRNLCTHPNFSFLNFKAQNGKRLKVKRLPLRVPGCRKARKHGRG